MSRNENNQISEDSQSVILTCNFSQDQVLKRSMVQWYIIDDKNAMKE